MQNRKLKNNFIIIFSILLVAVFGTFFTQLGQNWFSLLNKPTQWVPSFIFAFVWTVIYIIFSVVIINWNGKEMLPKSTLSLLILNGIFNVLWCLVFFTLKQTLLGLIVILLNLVLAVLLFINFYRKDKLYAFITAIYPIWILIATSLNTAIWILN